MPYIILYNIIWYIQYIVLYSSYGECNAVRRGSQASSSIVSIHLSLDKDYGIIIPYWNKGGNNVGNIEATFFSLNVAFRLQNVFQTSMLLINVAIFLKRCSLEKTFLEVFAGSYYQERDFQHTAP
jgi:hypothetical protein